MPYIGATQDFSRVNFLASEKFQSFTTLVPANSPLAVDGVIKAGTIFPANGATAVGILLHDVDLKNGDNVGALIVAGYVLEDRLPVVVDAAAKTALKDIRFLPTI